MWVLLAVAVVVIGFALKLNSMLVVTVAGLIAGLNPVKIIEAFGTGFAGSRSVTVFIVVLPIIGLIERYGLQHQARKLIGKLRGMTTGRLLATYLFIRQASAALGLTAIGGPAQAVRPIVAPMSEAAAERAHGSLSTKMREKVRSYAASADTVGCSSARTSSWPSARSCSSPASSTPPTASSSRPCRSPCGRSPRPSAPSSSMVRGCCGWTGS